MDIANRRTFLLAWPRAALTAWCAFGVGCTLGAARGAASEPTAVAAPAGAGSEAQPAEEPPAQEYRPSPWRVQPLPAEDDRTWLQEWLDLVALPSTKGAAGC